MTETEHLLDEWLADMAEADRQMEPPAAIEQRVMARVRVSAARLARSSEGRKTRRTPWVIAIAAVTAAVLVSLVLPRSAPKETPPVAAISDVGHTRATTAPVSSLEPADVTTIGPAAHRAVVRRPVVRRAPQSPSAREVLDFVPLVPMSEQELSGSFQIVRVQLSRGPAGPVQADVLLGEDGLARAIRISTTR
jgi:hypothetical protein